MAPPPPGSPVPGSDPRGDSIVGSVRTSLTQGSVKFARRAEGVWVGIGERVTEFVRDDGTIDFRGLRALLGSAVDSAGGVWMRLNGQVPNDSPGLPAGSEEAGVAFAPVSSEEEQFRLRELINVLERDLQAASKKREGVLRREDQLGKLIRAKEIRAMDDSVSAVRRTLAVRVLQLEMEKIFVSLAEEIDRSSVVLGSDQRLLVAEFGELDGRLLEMSVFIDNGEPVLVQDDALGSLASDVQYLKTRLGLDATLYTSTTLDWMQVRQFVTVSVKKTRAGIEFYARGMRLFIGDLKYAARLVRRAIGGYTPTPREVRTLRRTGRDFLTLIPFTIILVAPLTPVGHVLIFSFLQRYWPDFFPSTFSERRQALMKRYEAYAESLDNDPDAPLESVPNPDKVSKESSTKKSIVKRFPLLGGLFTTVDTSGVASVKKQEKANMEANIAAAESGVFVDAPILDLQSELSKNLTAPSPAAAAENAKVEMNTAEGGVGNGVVKNAGVVTSENLVNGAERSVRKGLGKDDLHLAD